jgi:hypothetical protein
MQTNIDNVKDTFTKASAQKEGNNENA